MVTILDNLKEACVLLCVVIFAFVVTNFGIYLCSGYYVWPVLYKDLERTAVVDFIFGWIDAREL